MSDSYRIDERRRQVRVEALARRRASDDAAVTRQQPEGWSGPRKFILTTLVALVIGLGLNNPTAHDVVSMVLNLAQQQAPKDQNGWVMFGEMLGAQFIEQSMVRTNLGIASLYTLTYQGEQIRLIGIAGHVFRL